jgi:prophage regulatory protein
MVQQTTTSNPILRRPSIEISTGMARTTIYRRIKQNLFPRPVDLGGGIVGWPANEIEAVNQARIAGKSDDEIKRLVAKLHEGRTAGAAA